MPCVLFRANCHASTTSACHCKQRTSSIRASVMISPFFGCECLACMHTHPSNTTQARQQQSCRRSSRVADVVGPVALSQPQLPEAATERGSVGGQAALNRIRDSDVDDVNNNSTTTTTAVVTRRQRRPRRVLARQLSAPLPRRQCAPVA